MRSRRSVRWRRRRQSARGYRAEKWPTHCLLPTGRHAADRVRTVLPGCVLDIQGRPSAYPLALPTCAKPGWPATRFAPVQRRADHVVGPEAATNKPHRPTTAIRGCQQCAIGRGFFSWRTSGGRHGRGGWRPHGAAKGLGQRACGGQSGRGRCTDTHRVLGEDR